MARPVGKPGETRERIVAAALPLFVENGVQGASLQQIADRLGLTKASVYHQFSTKEALIRAVVQPVVDALAALVKKAETVDDRDVRIEVLLEGMVDLVVGQRELATFVHSNRAVEAVFRGWPEIQEHAARITALLLGPDPGPSRRVAVSLLESGLMFTGTDPTVAGLPDDRLREELLAGARRLLAVA